MLLKNMQGGASHCETLKRMLGMRPKDMFYTVNEEHKTGNMFFSPSLYAIILTYVLLKRLLKTFSVVVEREKLKCHGAGCVWDFWFCLIF